MLWTTHLITGAAWGRLCDNSFTAATTGICWHLILDLVPHYDQQTELGYASDILAGVATLYILGPTGPLAGREDRPRMFWGAVGAGFPDMEFLPAHFFKIDHNKLLFPTHNDDLPQPQIRIITSFIMQLILILALFRLKRMRGRNDSPSERIRTNREQSKDSLVFPT